MQRWQMSAKAPQWDSRLRPFSGAVKQAKQPVYIVPCAIKHQYLRDPTAELEAVMAELERPILWRTQHGRSLPERIYRFVEVMLSLKEIEYLNRTQQGSLPERVRGLTEHVLAGLEAAHGLSARGQSVPERVKNVRRTCLDKLEADGIDNGQRLALHTNLDDAFFVVQLFSYPGDYLAERVTVERLADTLDKFEEDVLDGPYAGVAPHVGPCSRPVSRSMSASSTRKAARPLTNALEQAVQGLLTPDPD